MEEDVGGHDTERDISEHFSSLHVAESHLVVDDYNSMDEDSVVGGHVDISDDIQKYRQQRANGARTIYHQRRRDDDTVNSTRSLYDTDVVYYYLHGRRYCGDYYMPNDEDEQTRLQMLHTVHLYILDQRLTTAPLNNPSKILDIGTGTGDWAMAMGDEYPDAEIIGTDIAKVQPSAVPLNVFFEIDDAEEEGGWTWADDEFDLVHFRSMMGAFTDWKHIYQETWKHLKPGGWVEVVDFDDHKAMMQFFRPGSGVQPWLNAIAEGSRRLGRPRGIKHLEHENLAALGFVDVSTEEYDIPMGVWPEDPEERKIGKVFMIAQLCGVEALCLRVLTEQMGWDPVEVRRICAIVTEDVKAVALDAERARGLGIKVKVLLGRKPWTSEEFHDGVSGKTMTNGESVNGDPVNGV